jgi:6-pyruvoyltetrahydropterin/6-carboxytetrahydropterin synthase
MFYVTRKEHFNAAHKVHRTDWSDEQNLAVFGKCSNPNWHGHNYDLYVTVKGMPSEVTGFVMDLKVLSNLIKEKILDKLDHRNLNLDVPFMKGVNPTTENVVMAIWNELKDEIQNHGCALHCIKLHETERNCVEYFG